jgi:hypothetical protein
MKTDTTTTNQEIKAVIENGTPPALVKRNASARNEKNIRVVVARYNETLDWLPLIPEGYEIYVSNSGEETPLIPEQVRTRTKVVNVLNGGRETGHWLRYIISNYDALADIHIFIQGCPYMGHTTDLLFGEWLERPYVEARVAEARGFSYIYDKSTNRVASGGHDPAMAICMAHGRKFLPLPPPLSGGDWGGQHFVTREVIKNRPLEFYEGLVAYGCAPSEVPFEHSAAKELKHRFGWVWERAANVIYNVWPD